jgi:eukaryotic-like serine/threonine-protein kinase
MYEMLAGAHPYPVLDAGSGIGETEILAAHVHLEATPLPEVLPECPEALWRAVATCLSKRPAERFARAADLAEVLRGVAQRSMPPEHPSAGHILREAADLARARAVRGSAPGGEAAPKASQPLPPRPPAPPLPPTTATLPPGFVPPNPAAPSAVARSKLAMAQMFELAPAAGAARAGTTTEARSPLLPLESGAAAPQAARAGVGVSTERWEGAASVLPGAGQLARTEPWEKDRGAAGTVAVGAARRRTRWGLVAVGVVLIGLAAELIASWVLRLARG